MIGALARPQRVLVIDDDVTVAEVVARYLRREGFEVDRQTNGALGLAEALARPPDLLVLDLMLPGLNGAEVCRRLRAVAPVPVIMLTARGEERDRVFGLELGADDYVAKPFSPRELTARAKAVLRRAGGDVRSGGSPRLIAGAIEVDTIAREARRDGLAVGLTAREFDLLAHLMSNPGRVLRREDILAEVWGFSSGDASTVTVHIRRLREKVEADPSRPAHVSTVWGVGYRFDP
jgi:DNA-binding response OmpR family regulator